MKRELLNQTVKDALQEDFELFLVFQSIYPIFYDDEITPLYNPDWCRSAVKVEEKQLKVAQEKLIVLRENWENI